MSYNETLAERIRKALANQKDVAEKKMFGGLTFMVDDKMCCGVQKDDLMIRVSVEEYEKALFNPRARPMDFTGKPFPGFLYVAPTGCEADADLQAWVDMAVAYGKSQPAKKATRKRKA